MALLSKPGTLVKKEKKAPYSEQVKYGDFLFRISEPFNTKSLNVIRYGVKVGQVDKNEVRYDYHFAHFKNDFEPALEIDQQTLIKYYQGETINTPYPKGYVMIKYNGINVDIAKSDGRIIKNRLPKGLRKKFVL